MEKQAVSPTLEGPLSRATRRQSLSEIGFGRMDTYTKLDKLGEVTLKCSAVSQYWGKISFFWTSQIKVLELWTFWLRGLKALSKTLCKQWFLNCLLEYIKEGRKNRIWKTHLSFKSRTKLMLFESLNAKSSFKLEMFVTTYQTNKMFLTLRNLLWTNVLEHEPFRVLYHVVFSLFYTSEKLVI